MKKTNLIGMIIGLAVLLTAIFIFQAFSSANSAQGKDSPSMTRGNYPLHEPHQANLDGEVQASSAPIFVTGEAESIGLTSNNCFSTGFHAATDCDRMASAPSLIPVTGSSAYGPTAADCYSSKFQAATDCDRLASGVVFP
jgi:hypothetical protein